MPHEFEEHWLSAYLDNELSADERALVEQRLQADPAARQLLDDLKRVRSLVATLPSWQGDVKAAVPSAQSAAPAFQDSTINELAQQLGPSQAEQSTSLAASRLWERENAAAELTRRSMRWTTIVAVAAGLATLMLGAPYLFRSRNPVTEVAQHTDSRADEQLSEQNAPQNGPLGGNGSANPPAARFWRDGEERALRRSYDTSAPPTALHENAISAGEGVKSQSESAKDAVLSDKKTEADDFFAKDATPHPEQLYLSRGADQDQPATDRAFGGGRDFGAMAGAAPGIAGNAAGPLSKQASPSTSPSEASKAEALLGSRALAPSSRGDTYEFRSPAGDIAAAAPPLPALSEAPQMAGGLGFGDAQVELQPTTAGQVLGARSGAWTDEEVEAAMDRVSYFVAPSNMLASSVQPRPATNGTEAELSSADAPVVQRFEAAAANQPAPASGPASAAGLESASTSLAARKADKVSPAIGLARLPSDQSATDWLDRLSQERSLQLLQQSSDLDQVQRSSGGSMPEEAKKHSGAFDTDAKAKALDAKTVVLFVSASEARQILESLESNKPEYEKFDKANKESEPSTEAAPSTSGGVLPFAWWAYPQATSQSPGTYAKPSAAAGEQKVILILSQVPRG